MKFIDQVLQRIPFFTFKFRRDITADANEVGKIILIEFPKVDWAEESVEDIDGEK